MATPDDVQARATGMPESDVAKLVTQVNNLTTTLRLLTAKLDADGGVSDTDFVADLTDSGTNAAAPCLIDLDG